MEILGEIKPNSAPRPYNLKELIDKDALTELDESKSTTFSLKDLQETDEFWIVEIPTTIDVKELTGRSINLGGKSKFKIGGNKYCAINRSDRYNLTCVLRENEELKSFKTVNIETKGTLQLRRKLSGPQFNIPKHKEINGVQFPEKIKVRDPFKEENSTVNGDPLPVQIKVRNKFIQVRDSLKEEYFVIDASKIKKEKKEKKERKATKRKRTSSGETL